MIFIYLRNSRSGGALKYAQELIAYFEKNKIECIVEINDCISQNNIKNVKFFKSNRENFLARSYERFCFIKKMKINTVYVPYQVLPLTFWFTKTMNVVMVRNLEPFEHWRFNYSPKNRLRNIALSLLTFLSVTVSNKVICVAKHVSKRLWYVSDSKKAVIQHGINFEEYEHINFDHDKLTALIVGSGLPYRGLEDILNISSLEVKERYRFIWLGDFYDSRYEQRIQKLILSSEIDFQQTGNLSRGEVLSYISASDVYIASSRVEACPNTALEALNLGAKILAFETPSHLEFFPSSTPFYGDNFGQLTLTELLMEKRNDTQENSKTRLRSWDQSFEDLLNLLLYGLHREQ